MHGTAGRIVYTVYSGIMHEIVDIREREKFEWDDNTIEKDKRIDRQTGIYNLPLSAKYSSETVSKAFIAIWVTLPSLDLKPERQPGFA